MRKPKLVNKKIYKKIAKKCKICGNDNYSVLSVHRFIPGSQFGRYSRDNILTCCENCHRKIHAGEIIIDRYYISTTGKLLRIIIDGEEKFV